MVITRRVLKTVLVLGLLFAASCGTASVTETASTAESQGTETTATMETTEVTASPDPPATSTTSSRKAETTESTKADGPANTTTNTPTSSQDGIFFPKLKGPQRSEMQARGAGKLILTDNGCLRLANAGAYPSSLIIWPPGYSLNTEGNRVRIINENGQVAVEVGDEIETGGGEIVAATSRSELTSRDLSAIPENLRQELPERCPPPYRIAGFEVKVLSE